MRRTASDWRQARRSSPPRPGAGVRHASHSLRASPSRVSAPLPAANESHAARTAAGVVSAGGEQDRHREAAALARRDRAQVLLEHVGLVGAGAAGRGGQALAALHPVPGVVGAARHVGAAHRQVDHGATARTGLARVAPAGVPAQGLAVGARRVGVGRAAQLEVLDREGRHRGGGAALVGDPEDHDQAVGRQPERGEEVRLGVERADA